ncbi:MAG TPA: bifunctional oligoribonuclease/PAP phosphatase NrnA [Gemmatimonadales bacterium]|nr:bifunctional oligoribonuclease/PAP phosphatase NrnA [Gemmatimonadales bacterium]
MSYTLTPEQCAAAGAVAAAFRPGQRVCLTTHVNPDGDGLGSESALLHLLRARGIEAVVTNPTPTPRRFEFLFEAFPRSDRTAEAVKELRRADVIVVVDISDIGRLGMLQETVRERAEAGVPVVCIDHHVSSGFLPAGPRYVDPAAAATGELVFELATASGWPVTPAVAQGLYVAILTDTGGFRFSNTRPRTLRVAAELLETGIDPEQIYADLYANQPEGRPRLLAEVLQTLVVEPQHGLAWVTVPPGALERHGLTSDDLDGIVEFPRSIEGVRMALLFREIAQGRVKVSLRSIGNVDVADFARPFGGGGHRKAAGLSLSGSLAEVQATVLEAAREYLAQTATPRGAVHDGGAAVRADDATMGLPALAADGAQDGSGDGTTESLRR